MLNYLIKIGRKIKRLQEDGSSKFTCNASSKGIPISYFLCFFFDRIIDRIEIVFLKNKKLDTKIHSFVERSNKTL